MQVNRKAFYNEIDPFAAEWLKELILQGHIADGVVDTRSIVDIDPEELTQYSQCHFFAGIGGWSYALRLASWPDDKPVWTGSCPCQPFSIAGKAKGTEDERHLWPYWKRLIEYCKPSTIFGEQVDAAIGHGWLDLVQKDLENEGYAFGTVCLPACSVGAPHIRQRLWFVANSGSIGRRGRDEESQYSEVCGSGATETQTSRSSEPSESAHHHHQRLQGHGESSKVDNTTIGEETRFISLQGFWGDCEWVECSDGKYRPIEPSTFPLAHGIPARVGRLRGYGNAIVPQVAQQVIEVFMEYQNASQS